MHALDALFLPGSVLYVLSLLIPQVLEFQGSAKHDSLWLSLVATVPALDTGIGAKLQNKHGRILDRELVKFRGYAWF